jgi:Tol biopolymer transport system component
VAPEDLFKMTFLNSALISPDGTHVLVESSRMNGPKNRYDRAIDLVDVATGTLMHNVTKHVSDGDYDWMPDGRSFVFVRTLEKQKPQLYRYTLAGGTVVQLTHIKRRSHRAHRYRHRPGPRCLHRFQQSRLYTGQLAKEERRAPD